MVTISFTKFRQNAKTYFDSVEKGDIVRVIRHGKVIAHIVPPVKKEASWKKPAKTLEIPGASLSEAILKEREEQ